MLFFKVLFYAGSILALLHEYTCLTDTSTVQRWRHQKNTGHRPDAKAMSSEQRHFVMLNFFYFVWSFIGLFTINWGCFVVIFILGLIPKPFNILVKSDAIICIALIVFMLINTFHIGMDPGKYVLYLLLNK